MGVSLTREGLLVDGARLPLVSGSMHYWRHERRTWASCLAAMKGVGFHLVDLYVPWSVHEVGPGEHDFTGDRDVGAFLTEIADLGMKAIVRPGPHINAELTHFGIPARVVWDADCQARSPKGNPVFLPMVPVGFPVPSYASRAFFREARGWLTRVAGVLAPYVHPRGPIVLVQIDNEGALYFRDGIYDQDYHPDALAAYRATLADKYGDVDALARATGVSARSLDEVEPPRRFDATTPADLARHLDWAEAHEHLLARALGEFNEALLEGGLSGVPTMHNLPFGEDTTALNARRLRGAVDLVALDYYHRAAPADRRVIARRTTELSTRSAALSQPAFAAELGAGFPPFFPPLDEADSMFTLLAALAYGLSGFNLYMAVSRDRWIGGPIDPWGQRRPVAERYSALFLAIERTRLASLRRRAPVRLVTPRSLRRLTRVMNAFGPATGALFSVLGRGPEERCREDTLSLSVPIAIEGDRFLRAVEAALEAQGVPFAHVGGEDADVTLDGASWIVCATTGAMKPALFEALVAAGSGGAAVTLGPVVPTFDGSFRPLDAPLDLSRLGDRGVPAVLDVASAARAVAHAVGALSLPTFVVEPDGLAVTVHEDDAGAPRVAFLLNPTEADVVASVTLPGVVAAEDALTGAAVSVVGGRVEARVAERSVRMLALS
ncbi:MAG: beta-galactosidase [Polyangiaceae bacterium]|nr:beta-galactosidase [Polyangiaceae bacterium]